jgi:hypothetical protein
MKLLRHARALGPRLWPLGLIWMGLIVSPAPGVALDGPSAATAPGSWEISEAEGTRKCRIMLRAASGAASPATVGMPAGCKRAFPFLGQAGVWNVTEDHHLALEDHAGQTILAFAPAEEDRLVAKGPDGETYELEQVGKPHRAPPAATPVVVPPAAPGLSPIRPLARPALRQAAATSAPAATPVTAPSTTVAADPIAPVVAYPGRPADLAGRYIIRRDDRDAGCLLTLDGSARGPGGNKAQLAPACRDQGIVVFDPVGWHIDRGHLVLRARKGHDLRLQYHADGVWRKDPKEGGKAIAFKKI